MRPNLQGQYFDATGRPTLAGQRLLQNTADRLEALEAKLTAIAAITAPTGGATIDAESRAAINSIITGAS